MKISDYLVVAAPLTPSTRNLISTTQLTLSKKGQVIINVGRGPIINEEALVTALKSTSSLLGGAALDVYSSEPLPSSSPLFGIPNLLMSSHNADKTINSRKDSVHCFLQQVKRVLQHDDLSHLENIVDPSEGY